MSPKNHLLISTGISVGLQMTLHSWPATAACFLSGVLIDVDHYVEFYLHKKKIPQYQELVDFCIPYRESKVYLIFHAWEYLAALWFLIFWYHLDAVWVGMGIGLTVHMALDQFSNPVYPLGYFLAYRIKHGFRSAQLFKPHGLA